MEEGIQKNEDKDARYKRLISAFLEVEKELDQLRVQGFNLKHDMLKAIDQDKKKKIIDFINKL